MKSYNNLNKLIAANKNRISTITGYLNPIRWNADGTPIKFSIYTYEDEDIIISKSLNSEKLLALKNKLVQAKGTVFLDQNGDRNIKIMSIKEVKSSGTPPNSTIVDLGFEELSLYLPKQLANNSFQPILSEYLEAS